MEVKPRQDNLFDIWVHAQNGEVLLNSSQGYEHAADAEAIARLLLGSRVGNHPDSRLIAQTLDNAAEVIERVSSSLPLRTVNAARPIAESCRTLTRLLDSLVPEPVALRVTYRDGKTKTEQLR
ncbi:hypothetical protein [Mycolicibacterium sp. F2034L]|uniref:hypothetical protein n=1 Tax=Mycolicibacterium sp. F2034L TaxID=2926422 RepID=UPI001FF17E72|nr:hypothetical protein [Mycolicibacterium sp. F2034L]MCK0174776.1 hypothetical protein [Mycolicibacterium sp. F2034L]